MLCARGNNNAQTFIRVDAALIAWCPSRTFSCAFSTPKYGECKFQPMCVYKQGVFAEFFFRRRCRLFSSFIIIFSVYLWLGRRKKMRALFINLCTSPASSFGLECWINSEIFVFGFRLQSKAPCFVILLVCFGFNLWVCHFSMTLCLLFFSY